jgi:hypothetical protein
MKKRREEKKATFAPFFDSPRFFFSDVMRAAAASCTRSVRQLRRNISPDDTTEEKIVSEIKDDLFLLALFTTTCWLYHFLAASLGEMRKAMSVV